MACGGNSANPGTTFWANSRLLFPDYSPKFIPMRPKVSSTRVTLESRRGMRQLSTTISRPDWESHTPLGRLAAGREGFLGGPAKQAFVPLPASSTRVLIQKEVLTRKVTR